MGFQWLNVSEKEKEIRVFKLAESGKSSEPFTTFEMRMMFKRKQIRELWINIDFENGIPIARIVTQVSFLQYKAVFQLDGAVIQKTAFWTINDTTKGLNSELRVSHQDGHTIIYCNSADDAFIELDRIKHRHQISNTAGVEGTDFASLRLSKFKDKVAQTLAAVCGTPYDLFNLYNCWGDEHLEVVWMANDNEYQVLIKDNHLLAKRVKSGLSYSLAYNTAYAVDHIRLSRLDKHKLWA